MGSAKRDKVRRTAGLVVTGLLLVAAVISFVRSPHRSSDDLSAQPQTQQSAGRERDGQQKDAERRASSPADHRKEKPGTTMVARPRSDGSWDVVESVQLAKAGTVLNLRRPTTQRLGGDFRDLTAQISDLQVTAGEQLASVSKRSGGRWRVSAPDQTTSFELRYVLDGTTVRSVPSKAGRALTALAPLSAPDGAAAQVIIVAAGNTIRNLQCPLLAADDQACATGASPEFRLAEPLPRRNAIAVAQFDLPRLQ